MVRLGEVNPVSWDAVVDVMKASVPEEYGFEEEDVMFDWRKSADSLRVERELFEEYGPFKDYILHPTTQYLLELANRYVYLDVLLGDPLLPVATAVIILFMMHKRVSNDILVYAAAFMFNVNPLYVVVAALLWKYSVRGRIPKQYKRQGAAAKKAVGEFLGKGPRVYEEKEFSADFNETSARFDHVLVGNDIGTLFTAAVLSKVGHRCCVLMAKGGPTLSAHPENWPYPVPIKNAVVGRADRYQSLLDLVQDTNPENRVVFSPLGTEDDGYTHTIVAALNPGGAAAGTGQKTTSSIHAFRAGLGNVSGDVEDLLAVDRAATSDFLSRLVTTNEWVSVYLANKIANSSAKPDAAAISAAAGKEGDSLSYLKSFLELSSNTSNSILEGFCGEAPDLFELLSSVSTHFSEEALPVQDASAVTLAGFATLASQGGYYPAHHTCAYPPPPLSSPSPKDGKIEEASSGISLLVETLSNAVRKAGGDVYCGVPVQEIAFEDSSGGVTRAVGVRLESGLVVRPSPSGAVVSGLGAIRTYTKLIPPSVLVEKVSERVRQSLSKCSEIRPVVRVLFLLVGTVQELSLATCDYFESDRQQLSRGTGGLGLGAASSASNGGSPKLEAFADSCVRIWSPSARDNQLQRRFPNEQVVIVELQAVEPLATLRRQEQPSLPQANAASTALQIQGPNVYVPSQPNKSMPGQPQPPLQISEQQRKKLVAKATARLQAAYPAVTAERIRDVHVVNPLLGGHYMSSDVARFNRELCSSTDIPGLFLSSSDLTTPGLGGEFQSGWLAANAILGYTQTDLVDLQRNAISDLKNVY